MNRVILGDGLLGREMIKQTGWSFISRKKNKIDFCEPSSYIGFLNEYNEIINCIAFTDTYSENKKKHWETNYKAVSYLVDYCEAKGKKLIHISTDYIYAFSFPNSSEEDVPTGSNNWYTYTKLLSDAYIQLKMENYLIIRASFKAKPFPYPIAYSNITGNFDYVDVIAELIIKLIHKNAMGVFNVGTERKTMYELAKQTRLDVKESMHFSFPTMPENITMNIEKMRKFLNEN